MQAEIRAFFEQYRDAFNALDGAAVAAFYAEPSGIAQDGVYTYWPDRQPVVANMMAIVSFIGIKASSARTLRPPAVLSKVSSTR